MFFQPSFSEMITTKSLVCILHYNWTKMFFSNDFIAVEKQQLYVSHNICDLLWMCMMGIQY